MIWRGNQWVRAVRLYYHKKGAYPQNVDDLEKGLPQLHFLRSAAYKDPMNKPDGSWRFIYTNATGQLIGSTQYATLQQMALLDMNGGQLPAPQGGALSGVPVSAMASTSTTTGGTDANSNNGTTNANNNAATNTSNGGNTGNSTSNPSGTSGPPSASGDTGQVQNPLALLKPTGPVDGPVIGGLLTGVGGKLDKPSIRVYHGAKKYNGWEFIWNPLEDQAQALQQGLNAQGQSIGQPAAGAGNGTSPLGASPSPGAGGASGNPGALFPQLPLQASPQPLQ